MPSTRPSVLRHRPLWCVILLMAAAWSFSCQLAIAGALPISPGSWTLAVLPDTQYYSIGDDYEPRFIAQTQFLRDNAASLNLKYVLHEGDITQDNISSEWDRSLTAMNYLNGVVPYAMVTGNHDCGPNGFAANRDSLFNSPSYFGPGSYYASQPSIGGFFPDGKTANSWHSFTVGDQSWLIINLEWAPSDADLAWAGQVLDAHPDDRSMILTHAYMFSDNTRYNWAKYGSAQYANPHSIPQYLEPPGSDQVNDGEEIWDKLIRTHDNVDLVFSGHALSPGTGYRSDLSDGGHVVHQMLANSQDDPNGVGNMRLLEFKTDGSVDVREYSPYLDKYNTNFDQQFTIQLDQLHAPLAPAAPPLIRNAVAANFIVSGTTDPTTNTVDAIQIAQSSSPGFSIPISNRGDIELAVGGTRLQFYDGIVLSSITQFDRPDFVGRHASVEVGRNSFGDGTETLSMTETGNPAANEVNFNVSAAWFQFQAGFVGAHVNPDGTLPAAAFNGVVQANVLHPATGRYTVKLGVNSRTDGMLFTTGDNNSNVVTETGPLPDGSGWDVRVASNAQGFGASLGNQVWSFLYLPFNTPGLIGGYYDGTHDTTINSVGSFTMTRLAAGQYQLTVPGESSQTGMLILNVSDLRTVGGTTSPANDVLAYQPNPDGSFLIDSFNMPGNGLDDVAFDWAFISFAHGLTAAVGATAPLSGDFNADGKVDQQDYFLWRSEYGMHGPSLPADGNHDGVVDQADYVVWRASQSSAPNAASQIGIQTVPEPPCSYLMALAACCHTRGIRRRDSFCHLAG